MNQLIASPYSKLGAVIVADKDSKLLVFNPVAER
jgi:hypothetical protein